MIGVGMQSHHCSSGPVTVQDKVRAILRLEDTGRGFGSVAEQRPKVEHLSTWERDLVDWGAVYGLAFGIARAEDPFEAHEDVADRALAAAWPAYLEWSGEFATDERDTNKLAQNAVREYNKTANDHSRLPRGFENLEDALIGLANATGS